MSFKIIIGIIVVIALTLYVAYFNPTKVNIAVYRDISYEFPTAFFLFGLFFLGALVSTIIHILKSYKRGYKNWRESVHWKKERQIEESYIRGLKSLWEGQCKDAKVAFQAVLDRHPDHVDAIIKLGDVCRLEGNYSEAIKLHFKARSFEGDSIVILKSLEADYEKDNRKRELIETLEKIKKMDPGSIDSIIKMRDIFLEEGNWSKALDLQKELIQVGKNAIHLDSETRLLGVLHYEVANNFKDRGDLENAITEYRKSLKNHEKFIPSHLMLGEALINSKNGAEAVKVWKNGFRVTKAKALLKRLENYYLDHENPALIIEFYQETLTLTNNDPYISFLLGELFLRLEMLQEANKEFQKIEKEFHQLPEFHLLLGRVFQKSFQLDLAEAEFKAIFDAKGLISLSYLCHYCSKRYKEWTARCLNCLNWNTVDLAPFEFLIRKTGNSV